ncbi:MAG: threonine ammonia-lyase [Candidatus Eremiobacteraeota bacterium]|nr:threonine ammonia-lyase [Candidatus Eremiobacteraeota bacterium]
MLTQPTLPSLNDVVSAAELLSEVSLKTPFERSNVLSNQNGADVYLKFENRQHTNSFKMRGAFVKLCSLSQEQRRRGVVAASAGNHAQGVAYHAARMNIDATIVMAANTPFTKVRRTQALGARVILHGANLAQALALALEMTTSQGLTFITGYDDPRVIAGAGTVGLEMLQADPDLDALVVPVGGGGLISGIAIAAKAMYPQMEIIGVQTELFPALYNVLHDLEKPVGGPTLAEGVAVTTVGALNVAVARELVDDVVLVDEPSIERAIHFLLDEEKTVVEGAGAIGVAAILKYAQRFAGRRIATILSGGNIDTGLLASLIARTRLTEGRVVRLRAHMVDAPGGLAQVAAIVAEFGANVLDVSHHRTFTDVSAKCMELDMTIEQQNPRDVLAIVERLRVAGYQTNLLDGVD